MYDEVTRRVIAVCATVVALGLLASATSCGFRMSEEAEVKRAHEVERVAVCISNGGEWVRVPNVEAYECRRPAA